MEDFLRSFGLPDKLIETALELEQAVDRLEALLFVERCLESVF